MTRTTLFVAALATCWLGAAVAQNDDRDKTATAIFAGGCFWCTDADFEKVPGVLSARSGYIGGSTQDPTYKQVSSGATRHTEAVEDRYDPAQVTYDELLRVFWRSIDPLAENRQFCDTGTQYRSGIFYRGEQQREQARASLRALQKGAGLEGEIHTEITRAGTFWPAEDYHQDYYKKNPVRYRYYRFSCGRDARLRDIWGDEAGWIPG